MRILYLVFAHQNSFKTFCDGHKTGLSWVDAMLDELQKDENINIAIGVPVNGKNLQMLQEKKFTLFGLPDPLETNLFRRTFKRMNHTIENPRILNYAAQVINDFNPDIIQIFGTENPFGLITAYQDKPVVLHIQGNLTVILRKWFTGISRWQQIRYSTLKNLLLSYGLYDEFFLFKKKALREAKIIQDCKYFIGRTSFDKRTTSFLSPGSSYYHCHEFIRKDFFRNQWDFPMGDKVICVSILKGTTYKGIDLLMETCSLLMKYSTLVFEFRVCGVQVNEEIITILKKKFKNRLDFSKMKFLGRLNTDELINQLCNSNIFIHPSYIENSPNSVCEAMVLGMPIISTNVGGISSLIDDKIEGLLVQEGEPYSMAAAIMELVKDYDYARALGQNARKRSLSRHDPDTLVDSMLEIYRTIMQENDRK